MKNDSVDGHVVARLQNICERGGTESSVTFADQKFRRIPAVIAANVGDDELRDGTCVGIDAPEIFILRFADGMTESGADGVDENHVGAIEKSVGVVGDLIRSGRSVVAVFGDDTARTEGAHMKPDRG